MNLVREEHRKGKLLLAILYFLLKKNDNFCSQPKEKQRDFTHTKVPMQFVLGFAYSSLTLIILPLSLCLSVCEYITVERPYGVFMHRYLGPSVCACLFCAHCYRKASPGSRGRWIVELQFERHGNFLLVIKFHHLFPWAAVSSSLLEDCTKIDWLFWKLCQMLQGLVGLKHWRTGASGWNAVPHPLLFAG